ncbi:class I and II aminotransferase [Thermincola ferriacetica]|uniref:Aminotransferase n=1 Tax=Thermincola ferriacetica TaxID=281456 RepID=A0A0L6W6F3_9FIRM|nr:LL-diaminopimelate aminotransferase [Thermincola ferriacetica]KNZ71162.1 class I and II aminotransferase [Thermincola ferriacetica]
MERARRLENLTSAIFAEIDLLKAKVAKTGKEIINLGIGSPDQPPAKHVQEALLKGVQNLNNYGYPTSRGLFLLRETITHWYKKRFGVSIDPEKETLVLMGSQDGLGHLPLGYLDEGDIALVPDPGYPVYAAGVRLAGGKIYPMPLLKENAFLPDLQAIPEEIARQAKMMILNYPNNPVAAVANYDFFRSVVEFAKKYDILVCHDVAYSELAFDGYKPMSFLEIPGAKDIGVEFHSVSKTYNMAGCRLGFVVGNAEAIDTLACIKSNIDYGVFLPVQEAGIAALTGPQDIVRQNVENYRRRRDLLIEGLAKIGWYVDKPLATMFVWAPLPADYTSSVQFARQLLEKTGVVVVPGIAFGGQGEGYVRIALVQEEEIIAKAVQLIGENFKF